MSGRIVCGGGISEITSEHEILVHSFGEEGNAGSEESAEGDEDVVESVVSGGFVGI